MRILLATMLVFISVSALPQSIKYTLPDPEFGWTAGDFLSGDRGFDQIATGVGDDDFTLRQHRRVQLLYGIIHGVTATGVLAGYLCASTPVTGNELWKTVANYIDKHIENWSQPISQVTLAALMEAYPCEQQAE